MTATTELRKERFSLGTRTRLVRAAMKPPDGTPSPAVAPCFQGVGRSGNPHGCAGRARTVALGTGPSRQVLLRRTGTLRFMLRD